MRRWRRAWVALVDWTAKDGGAKVGLPRRDIEVWCWEGEEEKAARAILAKEGLPDPFLLGVYWDQKEYEPPAV